MGPGYICGARMVHLLCAKFLPLYRPGSVTENKTFSLYGNALWVCDDETGEWVELEDIRPTSVEVGCDEEPNEEELDASNLADLLNEHGEILIVEGDQGVRLSFMNIVGENEQGVNRAEMLKIIVEGFTIPEQIDDVEEFDDVGEGEWYDGFILEIVISSGEEIDFTPSEIANRGEIHIWKLTQYNSSNDSSWIVSLGGVNRSKGGVYFSLGYSGQTVWDEIEVLLEAQRPMMDDRGRE